MATVKLLAGNSLGLLGLKLGQLAGVLASPEPFQGNEAASSGYGETRPDENFKAGLDAKNKDRGEDDDEDDARSHVGFETGAIEVDLVTRAEATLLLGHKKYLSS
jgi:hypothetical protein